ncbi:MAG: hypothetical protein AAFW65_03470 [Pseudomonadota bacterium]
MNDEKDTLETERARLSVRRRLTSARSTGQWMPWVGFTLAFAWWGAAAGVAFSGFGPAIAAAPLPAVIAGGLGAAIPGFLILTAGFMGRESARAHAANAIVLDAADSLLTPSSQLSADGKLFASEMSDSAAQVDRAMGHALSAMKAMAAEIGDERLRLESVAYASADNARDLAERLAGERAALETLARELKSQTEAMTDAIPRQADLMVDAARKAGEEIAAADEALETRLLEMDGVGNTLGAKLVDLDTLATEAAKRSETLTYAVTRVEEKLEQSRKTVESAVRAGEMAAAAAGTTGDALKDAVSSALDGARAASADIHARTRAASEETAQALADLRRQCDEAVSALRRTADAAHAETTRLGGVPTPVNGKAEERSSPTLELGADETPQVLTEPTVTPPAMNGHHKTKDDTSNDDDLFEAGASDVSLRQRMDETDEFDIPAPIVRTPESGESDWRDILSDLGDDAGAAAEDREETAEQLITRLQTSGIRLPDAIKPKDKKKIAAAAKKGEEYRRSATLDAARRQVERVSKRLEADRGLLTLARDFITVEEEDALTALAQTSGSGRNASPRLSAFLLVDAALAPEASA